MFSGLRNKATAIVKSLDPVEHLKFLGKQVTDDPSDLNQSLRDVVKHLGSGPHHDRADQALGCMIASHASRHLSTIWTVLLQTLREAVDNSRAQLCLLKHFSHIANRIAIPQRANAFRVFAKEIMSVCGSQDIVGDRQFPVACNATLVALGVHADVDLARALMEKLLSGIFSWTRTDSKRAACSICATLTFSTTGCDDFGTTITNLQSSGRSLQGIALLVDNCLQPLMDQAVRLSPGTDPNGHVSVVEVSRWVVESLMAQLSEGSMEAMVLPILASCFSRLHAFAAQYGTKDAMIGQQDALIRERAVALLLKREGVKKLLWCPIISLLQQTGLSSSETAKDALAAEMALLQTLAECEDSMARCEALIAMARAVEGGACLDGDEGVDALVQRLMGRHRYYSLERCNLTVKGILRLVSACFLRLSTRAMASEVLHVLLRSHMDMSNNLNGMAVLQLEVLSLVSHTVGYLSGEGLAYLLMCLERGDAKVRERAIGVLIRLCNEATIEVMQLLEPTLRGVDFIEGAAAAAAASSSSPSTSVGVGFIPGPSCLASSRLLQTARNYYIVIAHFHHMLVSASYDTPKEENTRVQMIAEALQSLVGAAATTLGPMFATGGVNGTPLEHQLLAVLASLFNCVSGATPFPIDTVCIVMRSMVACVGVLAAKTTQFDVHFHKRLFSFSWNILVQCCEAVDAMAVPAGRFSQDASLYTGIIPPHPIMAAMVSAAGKTAMSSSEYDQGGSFFGLMSQCAQLLEVLLQWGHRSKVCIAHLRVQFHSFLAAMDVVVAVQPREALRCTRRLVLTVLTARHTEAEGLALPPKVAAFEELCGRVVGAIVPILNRSLSFDLVAVGGDVFGLLEMLAEIDTLAGTTVCYGTVDRSFQLFTRMVEIATEGSYYNAVSGPSVVPPIIRAMRRVLHSPQRLRAFQTIVPDATMAHVAEGTPQSIQFPALATIAALIRTSHDRLQCRVYADVESIVEGTAPSAVSFATGIPSAARHTEVLRWVDSTHNAALLSTFVESLGDTILAAAKGLADGASVAMDSDGPSSAAALRSYVFAESFAVAKKADAKVAAVCKSVAARLMASPSCSFTAALCAAALDRSVLGTVLQRIINSAFGADGGDMGSGAVVWGDSDAECLVALLEDPSSNMAIDSLSLALPLPLSPSPLPWSQRASLVHAARIAMTVLPPTVAWSVADGCLEVLASDALPLMGPLRDPLLVIAVRQSVPIPPIPYLHEAGVWSILAELSLHSPTPLLVNGSAAMGDWGPVGTAVRSLVAASALMADVRVIAQCVADTLSIRTSEELHAITTGGDGGEDSLAMTYFRHYLSGLVAIDDSAANVEGAAATTLPTPTAAAPASAATAAPSAGCGPSMLALVRCIPFSGRHLMAFPASALTVDDLQEIALVCSSRPDGAALVKGMLSLCLRDPTSLTASCIINVVCALVRCEVTTEDVQCDAAAVVGLLQVVGRYARLTVDYATTALSTDERLALRYSAMYLLVLVSPEVDGQWERVLDDTANSAASTELAAAVDVLRPLIVGILATVLELPPEEASIKAVAQATLAIFVRSSLLLGGINESILWLVVKCCPNAVWQSIVGKEIFSDTELGVLQFVCKMNQTVGAGPELVMELHARYTPLLLSYGSSKELDVDEQHMAFWLMTSLLLHIVNSEERHTKPKPHMALTDALQLYNDFPLAQMASPVVGFIRSSVDELLFPISSRLSVPTSERHWNIHARGHLLPVLGRRPLAKTDAGKMYSSILHMYLHVVNSVFGSLESFGPNTVSDTFSSLSVLASGNASLLKHSPAADGTVAASILQRLFTWYSKHAADSVANVDKSHAAVHFGNSLFPEPSSSIEFCDTFNILTCATVISSLFMRGNELLPGAVDVSFILDKMLSTDLISNQAALAAVVVMSGSSTRREMSYVAPLLTQRLLRELDRCMKGSLSFSFGIMQMLRTAFSILSAFPDDAVTMKVCEAVWNVVVNEGSGGRRIQHYAHFMLQSIVNLHTVSETQWSILRAIVSLPSEEDGAGGGAGGGGASRSTADALPLGGSFAFANTLFEKDSNAGKVVESGRQFLNELLNNANEQGASGSVAASLIQQIANGVAEAASSGAAVEWGFQPIRNSIVSVGMRRRAQLSVAESEEASTGASTVYSTTPNLLQLTTIASFVLRSHEGGEGGADEADRNRVTILDMLRQVDDEPSTVGDTFLWIVHALLETVLDPRDGMFVLLNRFNFSASSLYLFNQSLVRSAKLAGSALAAAKAAAQPLAFEDPSASSTASSQPSSSSSLLLLEDAGSYPMGQLELYLEAAGRRYVHADSAWWVMANALASILQWYSAACGGGADSSPTGGGGGGGAAHEAAIPLREVDAPLSLMVDPSLLKALCGHYASQLAGACSGGDGAMSVLALLRDKVMACAERAAAMQASQHSESEEEESGASFKAVVVTLQEMIAAAATH